MKYFKVLYFLFNATFINQLTMDDNFIKSVAGCVMRLVGIAAPICLPIYLKYQLNRYLQKKELYKKNEVY